LDDTRQCLESIFGDNRAPAYEIIAVDNLSTDGTRAYLAQMASEHENLQLILNSKNVGFPRGINIGAATASGEYLVFLHNDTYVTKSWLANLLRYLDDPQVGMVGPVTNHSANETCIAVNYASMAEMSTFAQAYTEAHADKSFEIPMLPFHCAALRRSVFEEVGPLDERFGLGMFEDDDYALRLKRAGYKIICAEDIFIHHRGGASFSQLSREAYWLLFTTNLTKFEAKWGMRWTPPQVRPEKMPDRLREAVDDQIDLVDVIHELRDEEIALLEQRVSTLDRRRSELEITLQSIYNSNSWKFTQLMMRTRSTFIPEGSQLGLSLKALFAKLGSRRTAGRLKHRAPTTQASVASTTRRIPLGQAPIHAGLHRPYPLVSIILPVYNHADLLEEAAQSVLESTYSHFELIILDDGSTDEVEPVLRQLVNNPHVRIYRQSNQKLPRALTNAHQLVNGEFITWISADNRMAPEALEAMVQKLLANPQAVFVYADVSLIDDHGNPLTDHSYRPQNVDPSQPDILRLYREGTPLGYESDNYINACFLYRAEAVRALEGYYASDLRGLEDYDFWLRLQKCGELIHLDNDQPLYEYRVHTRTMSQALLTEERDAHFKRLQDFITYEAQRRRYAAQPWTLIWTNSLSPADQKALETLSKQLPVKTISSLPQHVAASEKNLRFVSGNAELDDSIYIRCASNHWEISWKSTFDNSQRSLAVWKGVSIHPLALKARDLQRDSNEFPQASNRMLIGYHASDPHILLDLEKTRATMQANPQYFFVFASPETVPVSGFLESLVAGISNAFYAGIHPFGKAYTLYASMDAFWIPPLTSEGEGDAYYELLALSYACARPLLVPGNLASRLPAPYQVIYDLDDPALGILVSVDRSDLDRKLLDRYLESWAPENRLSLLLRYANAISVNWGIPRPPFSEATGEHSLPSPWKPRGVDENSLLKCMLLVNTLDKGGVEQLIAELVLGLPSKGIEAGVICVNSGGTVADFLKEQGVKVTIADGNPLVIEAALRAEQPHLVSSHWAEAESLAIARHMGIPVIETIHNTYVWYDQSGWKNEIRRSRLFTHAIAVSQLVLNYYLQHNPTYQAAWMTTIPNGIDPDRIQILPQEDSRRELGIPPEAFVFLMLGSIDARKNQLATLTAFEEVHRRNPHAHLLIVGNAREQAYIESLQTQLMQRGSNRYVTLLEFRHDTGLIFSAADVLVVNSFYEGWSLAATEALMAGVPLIHSDCGSGQELIGESCERGILIPNPGGNPIDLSVEVIQALAYKTRQINTEDLIQAMFKMISEQGTWKVRRTALAQESRQQFNSQHMLAKYAHVFRDFALVPA
jgi:GT2 family glycosyltransferase/glycosyltransferase involved in cell wall biosynthesis